MLLESLKYDKWIEVGWCLHSLSQELFLDDWVEFSNHRGSGYGDNETKKNRTRLDCQRRWNSMSNGGFTVALVSTFGLSKII